MQQHIHIYEIFQIPCVNGFRLKTHADAVEPDQMLNLIKVSEKLHLISCVIDTCPLPLKHLLQRSNQWVQHRVHERKLSEGLLRLAAFVNHIQSLPDV